MLSAENFGHPPRRTRQARLNKKGISSQIGKNTITTLCTTNEIDTQLAIYNHAMIDNPLEQTSMMGIYPNMVNTKEHLQTLPLHLNMPKTCGRTTTQEWQPTNQRMTRTTSTLTTAKIDGEYTVQQLFV